jgi:hypothetical protein
MGTVDGSRGGAQVCRSLRTLIRRWSWTECVEAAVDERCPDD